VQDTLLVPIIKRLWQVVVDKAGSQLLNLFLILLILLAHQQLDLALRHVKDDASWTLLTID
jgi:hypothetical protein